MNEDLKYLTMEKPHNLNFLPMGYFLYLLMDVFCFCLMFKLSFIYPFWLNT